MGGRKVAKSPSARPVAHVVAVSMGYGHERAANALRHLAPEERIVIANDYEGIPDADKRLWSTGREVYEAVSRFKRVPILGSLAFKIMDELQEIPPFYPRRDLSRPSMQVKQTYDFVEKHGLCRHLVNELAKRPLPLVCTFFTPAFAAEVNGYPGDIYIVICDADVSRAWVPMYPKKSRIKYFAPTGRVVERLRLYGVRKENIYLTGFPLPPESIGGVNPKVLERDLHRRMCVLDPNGIFATQGKALLAAKFGEAFCEFTKPRRPPEVTFAVGGAGTQREIVAEAVRSLAPEVRRGRVALNLVAGTREEVAEYFSREIRLSGLTAAEQSGMVKIVFERDRAAYFDAFGRLMRTTDVLWTKPSELSFYAGLGIPILMAPTVGSQEDFNRRWLFQVGGGTDALAPRTMDEWLFDWIASGALARMAWNGYVNAPTHGTYRIEHILQGGPNGIHALPLIV